MSKTRYTAQALRLMRIELADRLDMLDGTGRWKGVKSNICQGDPFFQQGILRDTGCKTLTEVRQWLRRTERAVEPAQGPPACIVPRATIYALALHMWGVHPRDLDAAGYIHKGHGGEYDNPRAAWYADQIEALILAHQNGAPGAKEL